MAKPLETVQEAEKDGAQDDKVETPSEWYRRPTPLWALGAAAVALIAIFGIWSWSRSTDPTPRRWSALLWEGKSDSDCFTRLATKPTSIGKEATSSDKCLHYNEQIERPDRVYYPWFYPHVAVYSTPASPHPTPTLRDLGDLGQAEAISFLKKDSRLKGGAWATLRDALDQSSTKTGEGDPFRFDRVLIANVAKGIDWMPGDRMVWTRILVQPINFTFAGYSVAATENQIKKVASLETTDSRKFSADISATIPGMEGPKASLWPSSEHTVKMNSDLTAQYEKLGIDIVPNFMRIMRESETGGDAVGNTEVSLTALTDPEIIRSQYPGDPVQRPSDEDPIVLLVIPSKEDGANQTKNEEGANETRPAIDVRPRVTVPHCALRAKVWMLYEERRVDGGRERYDESKQSVTLVRDAEDKQDVEIVSADEVSPAVWSIKLCKNLQCTEEGGVLRAKLNEENAAWRKVVSTDYALAMQVAYWLRTHPNDPLPNSSYKLNYPTDDNGTKYATLVPDKIKSDECKPETAETASLLKRFAG